MICSVNIYFNLFSIKRFRLYVSGQQFLEKGLVGVIGSITSLIFCFTDSETESWELNLLYENTSQILPNIFSDIQIILKPKRFRIF